MTSRFAAIGLLAIAAATAQAAPPAWRIGDYEALPRGHGNGGTLKIESVSKHEAVFSLQAYTCRRDCDTDEPQANMAIIERGILRLQGNRGVYRSSQSDAQTIDPELGTCALNFSRMNNQDLVIEYQGGCWWFGTGASPAGRYRAVEPAR